MSDTGNRWRGWGRGRIPIPAMARLGLGVLIMMALMLLILHSRAITPAPPGIHLIAGPQDQESGLFRPCQSGDHYICVLNGNVIWYKMDKIRLADSDAPRLAEAACDHELDLGEQAARRLMNLLNQGRFRLIPTDPDTDAYGRKLRIIMRGGHSLGEVLVAEGLATRRVNMAAHHDWCTD